MTPDQVESQVAAAAVERELAAALTKLSRGDRDVLLLYAWADLAYDEIATALGIPLGTGLFRSMGRKGVLLSQETSDFQSTILLEPGTYNYLGTANRIENEKVVEGTSLLRSGMVGNAGERP